MSELLEERWAVISERGCEAAGLRHADAAQLVRRLTTERVSGLCVVTEEAARRIRHPSRPSPNGKSADTKVTPKPKRGTKK